MGKANDRSDPSKLCIRFPMSSFGDSIKQCANLILREAPRRQASMPNRTMRILLTITPEMRSTEITLLRSPPRQQLPKKLGFKHALRIMHLLQLLQRLNILTREIIQNIALRVLEHALMVLAPMRTPFVLAQRHLLQRLRNRALLGELVRKLRGVEMRPLDVDHVLGAGGGGEEVLIRFAEAEPEVARGHASGDGFVVLPVEAGLDERELVFHDALGVGDPGGELGEL